MKDHSGTWIISSRVLKSMLVDWAAWGVRLAVTEH